MTQWIFWFSLAGAFLILEMFTGTFYLLMLAVGLAAGGVMALVGAGLSSQMLVAALVGIIATYGLRRGRWGVAPRRNAGRDPNVNLDIGQLVVVEAWHDTEGRTRTARVQYRGTQWDVELEQDVPAMPGEYVIREVRGSRLIVGRAVSNNKQERNS